MAGKTPTETGEKEPARAGGNRRVRYHRSKRARAMYQGVDKSRLYSLEEAVRILKSYPGQAKFNESVDLAVRLNIDVKQSEQNLRGSLELPHGTGKGARVVAFCEGTMAEEARQAGAVKAGGQELVEEIDQGFMDFDVAVAHPTMMRLVGRLGRKLGTKGLMPNPKDGTVTTDVVGVVRRRASGSEVKYRNDRFGVVHAAVGRLKFEEAQLVENVHAFLSHLAAARPATIKGSFITGVSLSSTMGPGLKIRTG